MPMNTSEAKKKLAEDYAIHPSKINRWYRGEGKTNIKLTDANALVSFFGLENADELFTQNATTKPIKAYASN